MELIILGLACLGFGLVYIGYAILGAQTPKHKCWGTETGRRYIPGIMETGGDVKGFPADEIVYGYTEVTYKCECGSYWNDRVVGKINDSRS